METFTAGSDVDYLEEIILENKEYMLWQYLPIKLHNQEQCYFPDNVRWVKPLVDAAYTHYQTMTGDDITRVFVYVTIKSMYVNANNLGNRPGWHIDGFGTEDHNYIWMDKNPTQIWYDRDSPVQIYKDHNKSMEQMDSLAVAYPQLIDNVMLNSLYHLDSGCIHRVNPEPEPGFRNFVKVSISKDRYLAEGNSINHILNYDWSKDVIARKEERNCPQGKV